MILVFLLIGKCIGAFPSDPNTAMDKVLDMVSRDAQSSYPIHDYSWKISKKIFRVIPLSASLTLTNITFWDATSVGRKSDVSVSHTSDLHRIEVQLALESMALHYGHYELKLPLLGTFSGVAEFELTVNSFGVSAYVGTECNRTRVYVWPPIGNPTVSINSHYLIARVIEYLFRILGSGIFQDIIDYNIIGDALDGAIREPLANAIGKVFCEDVI